MRRQVISKFWRLPIIAGAHNIGWGGSNKSLQPTANAAAALYRSLTSSHRRYQPVQVFGRLPGNARFILTPDLRQDFENFRQVLGAVALASVACAAHVGGVGFQHDPIQGQLPGQAMEAMGVFVGEHAAEAEQKAKFQVIAGLLQAAVEGVADASRYPCAS